MAHVRSDSSYNRNGEREACEDQGQMPDQLLTKRIRIAIVLGVLVALAFLIAAAVIFIQEGDWPARYISAGIGILAVMFIAARRQARKR